MAQLHSGYQIGGTILSAVQAYHALLVHRNKTLCRDISMLKREGMARQEAHIMTLHFGRKLTVKPWPPSYTQGVRILMEQTAPHERQPKRVLSTWRSTILSEHWHSYFHVPQAIYLQLFKLCATAPFLKFAVNDVVETCIPVRPY